MQKKSAQRTEEEKKPVGLFSFKHFKQGKPFTETHAANMYTWKDSERDREREQVWVQIWTNERSNEQNAFVECCEVNDKQYAIIFILYK